MPDAASTAETIVAISTPPGRGGIGIVRLSGPEAASIAAGLVRLRQPLEHGRARLAEVLDGPEEDAPATRIDEAIVGATLYPDGRVFFAPAPSGNIGSLSTMVPVDPAFCLSPYFNKF